MACARGILEQVEVPVRGYLVLTELGIEKNKNLQLVKEEIERVKAVVRNLSSQNAPAPPGSGTSSGGCTCSSN